MGGAFSFPGSLKSAEISANRESKGASEASLECDLQLEPPLTAHTDISSKWAKDLGLGAKTRKEKGTSL